MRWIVIKDGSTIHMLPEKSVTITINKNHDGTKTFMFVVPHLKIMQSTTVPLIFDTFEEATKEADKL